MYRIQFKHKESGREELLHESQYSFETELEAKIVAEELNAVDNPAWNGTFEAVLKEPDGAHDRWRH